MKDKLAAAKNFVADHKTALAVTATAAICIAINRMVLKQHDDFLREHDLYDAFHTMTEE